MAEGQPSMGRPGCQGSRRPRRPRRHEDRLLLRRRLPAVWRVLGGTVRATYQVPARAATGTADVRTPGQRRAGGPVRDAAPQRPGWRGWGRGPAATEDAQTEAELILAPTGHHG